MHDQELHAQIAEKQEGAVELYDRLIYLEITSQIISPPDAAPNAQPL